MDDTKNNFDDYNDPANVSDLISQLHSLNTKKEIEQFICTHYPNWLLASTDKYSDDYPHLISNWALICQVNNIQPQEIVIVDVVAFDDDHKLLREICNKMTQMGYVVRRKEEFRGCEVCHKAIPTKEVWEHLKRKQFKVPQDWSTKCSKC